MSCSELFERTFGFGTFDDALRKVIVCLIWILQVAAGVVVEFDVAFGFAKDIRKFARCREERSG